MAKGKSTAAAASTDGKAKKQVNVRTNEQLMGSLKGKVFAIGRAAYNVVARATKTTTPNKNGKGFKSSFSGVKALEGNAYPNGTWYVKTKSGGPYFSLDENSEKFKEILAAARSAKADIGAGKNTPAVHKFLDAILSVGGGGGSRQRDVSFVNNITL